MKKALNLAIVGAGTFLIVGVAALAINWYTSSKNVKTNVENYIASINAENQKITYDSVTVSGFPFSMNVSIINPHFVGRIDKLTFAPWIATLMKIEKLPQWDEDLKINGAITLSVNMISTKFGIGINGSSVENSVIEGKKISLSGKLGGDAICELLLHDAANMFGKLWNFNYLKANKDEVLERLRMIDCVFPQTESVNNETGETILTADGGRMYISREPQEKTSDIRLYFNLKNLEMTSAYNSVLAVYQQALSPFYANSGFTPVGKKNIEIDAQYSGTEDWQNPEAKNLPLDIKINKLVISDDSYNSSSSLHASNSFANGNRSITIDYKSESTANKLFSEVFKDSLIGIANNMVYEQKKSEERGLKQSEAIAKLASLSREEAENLVSPMVPDFNYLGKMETEFNGSYSGDDNFTNVNANLNSFKLSATPYGITANGNVNRNPSSPMPSGNLSILCRNCIVMVDDLFNYISRAKDVVAMLDESVSNVNIPPHAAKGVKDFLVAIQQENKSDDLTFDIKGGSSGVTVNGKSIAEVMDLFNKTVSPALMQQ